MIVTATKDSYGKVTLRLWKSEEELAAFCSLHPESAKEMEYLDATDVWNLGRTCRAFI